MMSTVVEAKTAAARELRQLADQLERHSGFAEVLASLVAGHGGISRVLRGHLYGVDPSAVPELEVPQDKVLILRRDAMEWL